MLLCMNLGGQTAAKGSLADLPENLSMKGQNQWLFTHFEDSLTLSPGKDEKSNLNSQFVIIRRIEFVLTAG